MRRTPLHLVAFRLRRIAGAHPGANVEIGQALQLQLFAYAGERRVEIFLDVVGQRLQRRHVNELRFVRQPVRKALSHQAIDGCKKRRQGFTGAGRRGDQHMTTGLYGRPGLDLRGCRRGKRLLKPSANGGMKCVQYVMRVTHLR